MDFEQPYTIIGSRVLNIRRADDEDAARAAWIATLLASPAAARRAAQRARVSYWRQRVARLEATLKRTERRARSKPWLHEDVRRLKEDLRLAEAALRQAEMDS
jgi:hypothetical protein